jgi:hypothetical protein
VVVPVLGDDGGAERHGSLDLGDTVRTRRDVEMDSVLCLASARRSSTMRPTGVRRWYRT